MHEVNRKDQVDENPIQELAVGEPASFSHSGTAIQHDNKRRCFLSGIRIQDGQGRKEREGWILILKSVTLVRAIRRWHVIRFRDAPSLTSSLPSSSSSSTLQLHHHLIFVSISSVITDHGWIQQFWAAQCLSVMGLFCLPVQKDGWEETCGMEARVRENWGGYASPTPVDNASNEKYEPGMEDIYAGGMEDIDSKQYNIIHAAVSHTLDDKTGLYRLFFFFLSAKINVVLVPNPSTVQLKDIVDTGNSKEKSFSNTSTAYRIVPTWLSTLVTFLHTQKICKGIQKPEPTFHCPCEDCSHA